MIYEVELENLFTRAALLVEHESPTPNLNDFFASRMGFEFVMLYRDLNNKLHGCGPKFYGSFLTGLNSLFILAAMSNMSAVIDIGFVRISVRRKE
jgi:hypothetical protein